MARSEGTKTSKGFTYGLIVFFCLTAGAFFFLRSSYFDVREFVVKGNSRVSREEIVARAGQTAGSIFAFDLDKASRLIETSPWIETAAAARQFPDTIVLTVVEREPVAFTPVGDVMWLVDGEGRILAEDDGTWHDLVALTGPMEAVSPGQFLDRSTYGWGLRVFSCLGPLSKEKLTEISVHDGETALILDDGCEVLMGEERNDPPTRTAMLESILEGLTAEGRIAERIDLRFERPAVKEQFKSTDGR